MIKDANKRNIDVRSGIVVNNAVDIQVRGHAKNTVTFYENIGGKILELLRYRLKTARRLNSNKMYMQRRLQ